MFFINEPQSERDFNDKLRKYSRSITDTFRSQGPWTREQENYFNNFLKERFTILEEHKTLSKSAETSKVQALRQIDKLKKENAELVEILKGLPNMINNQRDQEINGVFRDFSDRYLNRRSSHQIIDIISFTSSRSSSNINNDRAISDLQSRIREYENEISRLRRV